MSYLPRRTVARVHQALGTPTGFTNRPSGFGGNKLFGSGGATAPAASHPTGTPTGFVNRPAGFGGNNLFTGGPPMPGAYHLPPSQGGMGPNPPAAATPAPGAGGTAGTNPAAVAPFLTPQQMRDEIAYDTKYGYDTSALQRRMADAAANEKLQAQQLKHAHDVAVNMSNQNMAARGLFQSSIRDGAINDLDATLAMRNNILSTNLQRLMLDTNATLSRMAGDYAATHNYYNTLAAGNASAQTPVVPAATTLPPTSAATTPPPAQHAAPAPGSTLHGPQPTTTPTGFRNRPTGFGGSITNSFRPPKNSKTPTRVGAGPPGFAHTPIPSTTQFVGPPHG